MNNELLIQAATSGVLQDVKNLITVKKARIDFQNSVLKLQSFVYAVFTNI
jgi:hypothetical protein